MKIVQRFVLPAPISEAVRVFLDGEYNVDREKIRDGVIRSECVVTEEGDDRMAFELRTTEYKRKKTGGLDKRGTVSTVSPHRWNGRSKVLSWEYRGETAMIQLSGLYRLTEESPSSTLVTHEVTVEVKIPLLGGQIAKLIAKEFETRDPRYEAVFKKHHARLTKSD